MYRSQVLQVAHDQRPHHVARQAASTAWQLPLCSSWLIPQLNSAGPHWELRS
jgi:hypothetical protein